MVMRFKDWLSAKRAPGVSPAIKDKVIHTQAEKDPASIWKCSYIQRTRLTKGYKTEVLFKWIHPFPDCSERFPLNLVLLIDAVPYKTKAIGSKNEMYTDYYGRGEKIGTWVVLTHDFHGLLKTAGFDFDCETAGLFARKNCLLSVPDHFHCVTKAECVVDIALPVGISSVGELERILLDGGKIAEVCGEGGEPSSLILKFNEGVVAGPDGVFHVRGGSGGSSYRTGKITIDKILDSEYIPVNQVKVERWEKKTRKKKKSKADF